MRKNLLLLIIAVVAQGHVFAQTSGGPSHVLKPAYTRAIADTIYTIVHVPNPFEPTAYLFDGINPRITGYTVYKHGDDGLTDTVYINTGLARIDINRYDENQRVVYSISDYPPCLVGGCHPDIVLDYRYEKTEYEYDAQNRVSKVTTKEVESLSGREQIVNVYTYDYSTLRMTEKGYIYNGYEYELDSLNRITYLKNLSSEDEYRELYGKRYRVQDSYYTYFEGGFSVLRWEETSKNILGWVDRWVKVDHFFIENGRLQNTYYSVDNGETWAVWEKIETRYAYVENVKSGGDNPSLNESPELSGGTTVYGISGAIVVSTGNGAQACIYDTTGRVVKKQPVYKGTTQITVPGRGLYFVVVNNHSYKVMVR
jgi:hypothetical protein